MYVYTWGHSLASFGDVWVEPFKCLLPIGQPHWYKHITCHECLRVVTQLPKWTLAVCHGAHNRIHARDFWKRVRLDTPLITLRVEDNTTRFKYTQVWKMAAITEI